MGEGWEGQDRAGRVWLCNSFCTRTAERI